MDAPRKHSSLPILILAIGLGVAGLAGCAQRQWVKDGANAADLNYDQGTCEHLARLRNRYYEDAQGALVVSDFYDECMEQFGWTLQKVN